MMALIPAVMSRPNLGLNIKERRTSSTEAAQVPLLMKVTSILALSVIRTLKKLCLCNLCIKEILYSVTESVKCACADWYFTLRQTHYCECVCDQSQLNITNMPQSCFRCHLKKKKKFSAFF